MKKYQHNTIPGTVTEIRSTYRLLFSAILLMILCLAGAQDTKTYETNSFPVKGIIRDAHTLEPVPAAQILAPGSEVSAISKEDGTFSITLKSPNDILLISAFNFNQLEFSVRGRESLEINLYPDIFTGSYKDLDVLTGKIRASFYPGAATPMENVEYPFYVSIDEAIPARSGGEIRSISRSGLTGIGSSLFIRGYNSVYRNAQPLLVVDGVIWDSDYDMYSTHDGFFANSLADIDLNDIESVTVLKNATSLYGSKGANGIIILNTRRATDMTTKITVNTLWGISEQPGSLPMMNGDQFRIYATELLSSAGYSSELIDNLPFAQDDPSNTYYYDYHNNTNWDDEVYQRGLTQSYNIGVTGGDDKAMYAFSLGYTGDKGVVKTTDMQRLNMRFNGDFHMTKFLDMGVNIGFTNLDRILLDDGVNYYTSPTFLAAIKAPFLSPYGFTVDGTQTSEFEDSDIFGVGNPSAIIVNSLNTNKHYRLNLGAMPVVKLSPSLTLSSRFDYSLSRYKETYYSPMVGVSEQELPGLGVSENVFKGLQMRNSVLFNESRLQYTKKISSLHRINMILGWRYLYSHYEANYAEGHNSGTDQKRNLLNEEEFKRTAGLNNRIKSISNFASIDYLYDNRYFINAVVSMDGSSRFGQKTRGGFQLFNESWGIFPSLNLGWLISSESFLSSIDFIDRLKFRTGFGLSGNDDIDPFGWTPYFVSVQYMDRANGIIFGNIGNSEIQWETSSKLNIGLDANLFNDYLYLSGDIYFNRTSDLLYLEKLPPLAGEGYFWTNGGEISNRGFEILTRVKILNLSKLHWELEGSIGHYKNEILSSPGSDRILSLYGAEILVAEGNPAGAFYGYRTQGVLAGESEALEANLVMPDPDGTYNTFGPGDVYFVDQNSDGIIDQNDKQIIGDPNPDFYGAFSSRLHYGNFSLEAYFTFSYGNDIYNYYRRTLENGSMFINQTTAALGRWRTEGQQTDQPMAAFSDPMGNARFSDRWIEDGSYLKFKSLTLSYTIPYSGNAIDGLTVWITANNILTLTEYLGRDPEVSINNAVLYQGIDRGLLPQTRNYFIGVKLNL